MARLIKRTWFISIDFRFKKDANYDKRLKAVKDYFKEIGFVEGDTTSSLIIFDDDDLLEDQVKSELITELREKEYSNAQDFVVLRSVVRPSYLIKGKVISGVKHYIQILDKNADDWKSISEQELYNKLQKEQNMES